MKKKKLKIKNVIVLILMLVFIITLIISIYKIVEYLNDNKENQKIKEDIKEAIIIKEEEEENNKYEIDFNSLKEKNSDAVAYLKVNNTNIDYIVVKGNDNSYYLNHNFNKKYNVSGWIFADFHNKFDDSDKNIVIYGHNTHDGSMFGTLKNVLEKEWDENPDNKYIVLVTKNGTYYYEVFSVYSVLAEDYYINTVFNGNQEFNNFIKVIKERSIFQFDADSNNIKQILTLSSCTNDGKKRVVLHAKLLEDIN